MAYGLRADGLSVNGTRGKAIIEGVDLEIGPGSFVAIIGASGSGKSTLLKALGLRLPNRRRGDKGTLSLIHEAGLSEVTPANHDDLLSLLSFVPQADIFIDRITAGETLRQACTFAGSDPARVGELLAAVGLGEDTAQQRIAQLSGGQKRRLSIAHALASYPALLLLDEPTSGLDLPVAHEVMALLKSLAADKGITVVCTSHQPSTLTVCDRVLVLAPGSGDKAGHLIADHDRDTFRAELELAPDGSGLYRAAPIPEIAEAKAGAPFPATADHGHWRAPHFVAILQRCYRSAAGKVSLALQASALALVIIITQLLHGGDAARFIDFFLAVAALWVGMTISVRAFVTERMLFAVDEIGGLTRGSYFSAKVALSCAEALVGALALALVSHLAVSVADGIIDAELVRRRFGAGDFSPRLIVLFATCVSGAMIGLLISALARSERAAIALMPLALLPQVVFSRFACGYSNRTHDDDGFPYQALEHGASGAYNNPLEMLNFFASLPMSTRHASWAMDGAAELFTINFGALCLLVALQCFLAYIAFVSTSNRWLTLIR